MQLIILDSTSLFASTISSSSSMAGAIKTHFCRTAPGSSSVKRCPLISDKNSETAGACEPNKDKNDAVASTLKSEAQQTGCNVHFFGQQQLCRLSGTAEQGGKHRVTNSRQEGNINEVQRVICCLMKSLSRLKIYSAFTVQFCWSGE